MTVHRLHARSAIAMVVVGTCWDLGAISAIPQLLRWLESTRGLRMSEQPAVCRVTGGASVGAPIIEATPEKMRSVDGYTPLGDDICAEIDQLVRVLHEKSAPSPVNTRS
ncbi:hypothetical protein [Mycobacterium leprae]|uniref:hypothetical protein n=1 Tax=Mycobacterium leprae TaxID=1769 RepID=UPI001E44507E|nr:hypothetical protein [Mycobacterium leprae]